MESHGPMPPLISLAAAAAEVGANHPLSPALAADSRVGRVGSEVSIGPLMRGAPRKLASAPTSRPLAKAMATPSPGLHQSYPKTTGIQPPTAKSGRLPRALGRIGLVAAFAWGSVFNISEVRGSSMEPGILNQDHIMVDHLSHRLTGVDRGDIVVLQYPLDPSLDYIKRVIGVPGDEVVIARGSVYVNGEIISEPYVDETAIEPWTSLRTIVRADHCFVLGDNRRRSSDSREFGQVPYDNLKGTARFCFWPAERIGRVL